VPSHLLAKFQIQAEEEIEKGKDENKIIEFDSNSLLKNIDLLPNIYQAIKNKQVIKFEYEPYGKKKTIKIIHPHYLKEYNSRWFVFGKEDQGLKCNLALDRIMSDIEVVHDVEYQPSVINYATYFENIIGVTHLQNKKINHIEIKTLNLYTHERMITKPIHKSQMELHPFSIHENGESYGMISIDVIPNFELLGVLMTFESNIEIMSPISYREYFSREIQKMNRRYSKK
jgi:predicted DNA-binding transcriptional regulator YafY